MTVEEVAQLALAWPALLLVITAVLSRRNARWSWAAAGLLFSAWLLVTGAAVTGTALAAGSVAAVILEDPGGLGEADFSRTTRRLGLLAVGLAASVLVLVSVAQVDAVQAPHGFPVLASGVLSLIIVFAAADANELHRAVRLLLIVAAIAWTVAIAGREPAATIVVAAALPLTAVTRR